MKITIDPGVDTPLGKRLAILTMLRLVVLSAFFVVVELYYDRELAFGGFSSAVAVATTGVAFALSASYAILLRRGRKLELVAYLQLATDQLTWTAVAYISGGVTSGTTSLYGLTCLSGAILLGTRGATYATFTGVVAYLGMCVGFAQGWLKPPLDQSPGAYVVALDAMIYPAFSTIMATGLVGTLASFLTERLRTVGGRLEIATQRVEQAERLAALGRLAAALAHEIRNPLGSIQGSVELIRTGGTLNAESNRLCKIVERETARLNDLVTDMLDLSRPREPGLRPTDLAATAQSVVDLAKAASRGEEMLIRYEGPASCSVKADPAQMRQVLWNLVRNAVQASSAGGEICVKIDQKSNGDVVMNVVDNGIGIPDSMRNGLFDAFVTTRSHGAGIGLAVVKQIADAHAFDLEVVSEEEVGTTFSLRIPKREVLVAAALLLCGLGASSLACSGQEWVDGRSPPPGLDTTAMWWGRGGSKQTQPPHRSPSMPAGSSASGDKKDIDPEQPGATIETYRNTYYFFPSEKADPGPTRKLFDAKCKLIRTVSQTFHDQLCVQGSGRLRSGETVSFAIRDCPCANLCPRTDQKICFELLKRKAFPYGRGASGKAITPLRTVAVDSTQIPLGTVMYIPDYQGLRRPDGSAHDGCFVADDRGLKVLGKHIDIFAGDLETVTSWNKAVPTGQGIRVLVGANRCKYLQAPTPHGSTNKQ